MLPLRYAGYWQAAGWAMIVSVLVGALLPLGVQTGMAGIDKLAHFLSFLLLTLWFNGIYRRSRYPVVALLLLGFGLAIELAQTAASQRVAELHDFVADGLGIAAGLALSLAGLGEWCTRVEAWLAAR